MYCAECGRFNDDIARFCAYCGKPAGWKDALAKEMGLTLVQIDNLMNFELQLKNLPVISLNVCDNKRTKRTYDLGDIKFSNITKSTDRAKLFPFVVVDVETTGLKSKSDDIIEVSAIKYECEFIKPVSCISTLIKPSKPIPPEATHINGITNEMVADAPSFYQIVDSLNDYVKGCNIIGHNLMFDIRFLYINNIDFSVDRKKCFDTLSLAQTLLKKQSVRYNKEYEAYEVDYNKDYDVDNYKLDTLCDYYNIKRLTQHRSLSDCLATAELFKHLMVNKQGYS